MWKPFRVLLFSFRTLSTKQLAICELLFKLYPFSKNVRQFALEEEEEKSSNQANFVFAFFMYTNFK